MIRISTVGSSIIKELQRAIFIFYINFFFLDGEICSCYRASCFSAVFAMAEMAAWLREYIVVDGYSDASAKTAARYGLLE